MDETDAGGTHEEVAVEVSEESKEALISIRTEHLKRDFTGEDFAIGHLKHRFPLSQGSWGKNLSMKSPVLQSTL